jgi:serine/threonine-protein kinase
VIDERTLARWRREREAYYRLLELPPDERAAAFAEIERDDTELAAALRRPLAEAEAGSEEGHSGAGDDAERIIGRFRLLRRLGTGGMGEVHLAERVDDVAQKVALKLVRSDLPVPTERARRERQILARLNHPNIAGLIDAGVTDSGQPWFAMAYVDGERITAWCDRRQLNLHARARLFAKVCRAVQFAHKNLVLHRDLKPSNILVSAEGVPMLLDFGIAKLLDATDPRETQTLAMTPAYAAPEQLRGEAATTAGDIYQLGLVLYELLGGIAASKARESMPAHHDGTGLPRLDHTFAALAAREPAAAARIAGERSTTADKLRRQLRGDLGRIVSKAAADAPHERYDTAQALADDLDRWTRGLPVSAHRGSLAYRARKLVRRHAVAAVAVVLLSLGLVATSLIAVQRARTERVQREQAEQQRQLADQQRGLAERQRQRSETLLGFMRDVFHEAEPNNTGGAKLDAGELLQRATRKLDARTDLDAATRAVLLTEVADVFHRLGHREAALAAAERAERELAPLREAHPADYLRSAQVLAMTLYEAGRYQDTVDLAQRALVLDSAGDRASRTELAIHRSRALAQLGQRDTAERDVAAVLADYEEAGIRSGDDYVMTLNELAHLRYKRGDSHGALDLLRRQVDAMAANPNRDLAGELAVQQNIAQITLTSLGDVDAAIVALQPLIPRVEALFGADHSDTVGARTLLALAYVYAGDLPRADEQLRASEAAVKGGAASSVVTAAQWRQVGARLALQRNDPAEALRLLRMTEKEPAAQGHWQDWLLGEALLQARQFDAAHTMLDRAYQGVRRIVGSTPDPALGRIEDSLGRCALMRGDLPAAQDWFQRAVEQFRAAQGADKPTTVRSEIHQLWAAFLVSRTTDDLDRLRAARERLVKVLGGAERLQVWQLDLLIDDLARSLRQPGLGDPRRAQIEAALRAFIGAADRPQAVGLSGFN